MIGSQARAEDALSELHMGGLIHRHDEFVWATASAIQAHGGARREAWAMQ